MKLVGRTVRVHRNLHKKCWSIVDCRTGRVLAHRKNFVLHSVQFVVQPGGRKRALREKKRNVHAYAKGVYHKTCPASCNATDLRRVRYNPFIGASFFDTSGRPVDQAWAAHFCAEGSCFVT